MKVKIPEGDHCNQCEFYVGGDFDFRYCNLHSRQLDADATGFTAKLWRCKNKEPIIIQYGEADENKKNIR